MQSCLDSMFIATQVPSPTIAPWRSEPHCRKLHTAWSGKARVATASLLHGRQSEQYPSPESSRAHVRGQGHWPIPEMKALPSLSCSPFPVAGASASKKHPKAFGICILGLEVGMCKRQETVPQSWIFWCTVFPRVQSSNFRLQKFSGSRSLPGPTELPSGNGEPDEVTCSSCRIRKVERHELNKVF